MEAHKYDRIKLNVGDDVEFLKIIRPDGVTSIGDYAFVNYDLLTSVVIPDSVTSIGGCAFGDCASLESVTIGNGVTSIGYSAFGYCTSLKSVVIPDSVTTIGENAFIYCSNLEKITIGVGVTSIDDYAFYECSHISGVYIKDVAAWLGITFGSSGNPLSRAHNLYLNDQLVTELVIPEGVTEIRPYAFCGYTSLESIDIPDSVTSIGKYAFYGCTNLTTETIPDSVTSIGEAAFESCINLNSITIGSGVTSIGTNAFNYCTSLTSVTIPKSVTSIGSGAFFQCENLTNITVDSGNTKYHSSGNCLIETESKTLIAGCQNSVIPSDGSVTSIAEWACACTDLSSLTIPEYVTSIGCYAFYGCIYLTSVTFENTDGWYLTEDYAATEGEAVSVTDPSTNATNLNSTYYNRYFKRNG